MWLTKFSLLCGEPGMPRGERCDAFLTGKIAKMLCFSDGVACLWEGARFPSVR